MTMRQCFCIRINNFRLFPRLAFKKRNNTRRQALILGLWTLCWLCVRAKPLGVQHRASLPVPCQRELACGKARLFQILLLFVTHATSKSRKPYLPSRLRDRRPDYLHFRKHRQPRTTPRPALPKIQIRAWSKDASQRSHKVAMHGRIKTAAQSRCTMQRHKWLSMHGRSDHKRPQVGATTIIHYSSFIIH